MNCGHVADLIGPYVDDELPAATRRRIDAHLLLCTECAWDAQTLRITRDRLRDDLGEVVASDAFRARTLARLLAGNPHLAPPGTAATNTTQYQLPIEL